MEPKLGKMLILGAIFNCLDPVLTIVAGLSVRDPFLTPFDKKDVSPSHAFCFLVGSETKNGLIFLFFFLPKLIPYLYLPRAHLMAIFGEVLLYMYVCIIHI